MFDRMELVREIAEQLNEIPGGKAEAYYHLGYDVPCVRLVYNCPCGELSMLDQMFNRDLPITLANEMAENMKESMRIHVRREGNEPNF